jgi:hypothetical protein
MELPLQLRQDELGDAGVHLSHEGTDANGTDDEPVIAIKTRNGAGSRHMPSAPACSAMSSMPIVLPAHYSIWNLFI